ncbi:hypothetical protein VDG1235_3147 [Verrucomicrobiia bacterium DG1235]|nr:hypothetical protein VDG1235_3147 [Verrucomicrobiae bacterium DG1235]
MKTFKSTLNRYLLTCLLIVAGSITVLSIESLSPYREALAAVLGLPSEHIWILGGTISIVALVLLFKHLHTQLTEPLENISSQCAHGNLDELYSSSQTREIRIIREYIRQNQERAEQRAAQITRMENELYATRKERDKSFSKLEEYEDLVSNYGRIRKELSEDNTKLRHENLSLKEQVETSGKQAAQAHETGSANLNTLLDELRSNSQEIRDVMSQLVANWDEHSLVTLRSVLNEIAKKSEAQLDQIKAIDSSRSQKVYVKSSENAAARIAIRRPSIKSAGPRISRTSASSHS